MRARSVAVAVLLVLPLEAHGLSFPCPGGRFLVEGPPLVDGGAASDAIVLEGTQVSVESGCDAAQGRIRAARAGTRVRVRWVPCGSAGLARLKARIDSATCNTMTGTFRTRQPRVLRSFTAIREGATGTPTGPGCAEQPETFTVIQDRIFTQRGCNVTTCHGNFAQGSLDLRPGSSLLELVDVAADNPVAAAAGKLRVRPGNAAASFLSQKLRGTLVAGEGSPMPLIGASLPPIELDLIDAWINAGAPPAGTAAGAPCLPEETYEPTPAPPPPPGGYQIVLDGPTLQPGQEQEGCLWIQVPNPTDFAVGKWEFALNPGTHHFAIFGYNQGGVPQTGVWQAGDVGCISGAQFGNAISGSPQSPYFIDAYPPGIARMLSAGSYIGLNAHYHNPYTVPIQMKVWTNVYPYEGTPEHLAETIIEFDDMFTIYVPPFTQKAHPGRFTNNFGRAMNVFQVTGHMHKRGLRFTAWASDGSKLYENYDWSHPIFRHLDPPFVLAPGDHIDYECLHDNGVTRAVKRDAAGNPIPVTFGLTTDDEMCTLNGQYYLD